MATVRRAGRPDKPERPRRRRLTAAERHRRTFFAKLTELRKRSRPRSRPDGAAVGPSRRGPPRPRPRAPRSSPSPRARSSRRPPLPQQQAPQAPRHVADAFRARAGAPRRGDRACRRPGGRARGAAAQAPRRRRDDEVVLGLRRAGPGRQARRPDFTAWVRLAATPVRDVKAIVNPRPAYDSRGGRGGRGGQRRPAVAAAAAGGGGGYGGGGGGGGGGGRGDRGGYGRGGAGRGDIEQHGRDGGFSSSVRIIGLEALQDAVREQREPPESEGGNGNGAERTRPPELLSTSRASSFSSSTRETDTRACQPAARSSRPPGRSVET